LPALLAKEECAAFPLFLLLLHLAISRNRKELAPIASMGALALAAGSRVIWATGHIAKAGSGFGAGIAPLDYLAAQGWVIFRYLRLFLIPAGFTVDPDIRARFALVAWALLAALALIALRRFDRAREGFWFLGALALLSASSSVFPAADLAADRRMYLPLSALCVAAAYPLAGVRRGYLVAVVGILTLASIWRCEVWRTERSLWSEAARMAPEKVRPMIQLSRAVRPESALLLLENARKIAPDDPAVASALGRSCMESGMYAQALAEFGRALALSPGDPKAMNNRGAVLLALGQRDAAIADFHRALSRDPCLFDALINLRRTGIAVLAPAGCRFTAGQAQELRENVTAR
jgi:tetratricopeptide (TPR) repeat protein